MSGREWCVDCGLVDVDADGRCGVCGGQTHDEPSEEQRLRAEVRDLKARLKVVRRAIRDPDVIDPVGDIERATDLRVKNWRKP